MITVAAGEQFPAFLNHGPGGLVGTLGVAILNTDTTVQTARTTAGIFEVSPASGNYVKPDMVAPSTVGDYLIVWDDGATFVDEELSVRAETLSPDEIAPNALTSLERLAAYLDEPIELGDPTSFAIMLINGFSNAIWRYTGREFVPKDPVNDSDMPVARKFRYDGSGMLLLKRSDLRSFGGAGYGGTGGITLFTDRPTTIQYSPVAGDTTTEGDYRLEPRGGTPEGTYLWIAMPTIDRTYPVVRSMPGNFGDAYVLSSAGTLGDEVTITGYWGIGTVPEDVELACLMACEMEWRRESARAAGSPMAGEAEPVERVGDVSTLYGDRGSFWLPYGARSLLFDYIANRPKRLLV